MRDDATRVTNNVRPSGHTGIVYSPTMTLVESGAWVRTDANGRSQRDEWCLQLP